PTAAATNARNASSKTMVLMPMLLNRPIRNESDQSARPIAMRSSLRQLQPIAARMNAMRARNTSSTPILKFMRQSSSKLTASRSVRASNLIARDHGDHQKRPRPDRLRAHSGQAAQLVAAGCPGPGEGSQRGTAAQERRK